MRLAVAAALLQACLCTAQTYNVTVTGEVLSTVGPQFHGLHYDGPNHDTSNPVTGGLMNMHGAFGSPSARERLRALGMSVARIFVNQDEVHPNADTWAWETTDAQVAQVLASGMEPMLCLRQAGAQWLDGTTETPWWKTAAGKAGWEAYARGVAERYRDRCRFYEVFNEPNTITPEKPDYFGWDGVVGVYLAAAEQVKAADPDAICGGAATWAAWETAAFGKAVLKEPRGEALLDFLSFHIYTSHNLDDPTDALMGKTPWFEQTPRYIRGELAALTAKGIPVFCTEYNSSAVCAKDGKPYTDPRNMNVIGGVLTASVLCRSAAGGTDMAMHFATIGGFGLIVWPPEFQTWPCYWAYALLSQVAGLTPGAQVLVVETDLPSRDTPGVVLGTAPDADLEAFAVRSAGGACSVVLIHKKAGPEYALQVALPGAPQSATLYRYDLRRLADAMYPLEQLRPVEGRFPVTCPGYSVTVLTAAEPGEAP